MLCIDGGAGARQRMSILQKSDKQKFIWIMSS